MLFINESGNAVNELLHMLAGKIDSKYLIPNTGGRVYVLAFFEGTLVSLGFFAFLFVRIFTYVIVVFMFKRVCTYVYNRLFTNSKVLQPKEPVYLQNYIKNRNA